MARMADDEKGQPDLQLPHLGVLLSGFFFTYVWSPRRSKYFPLNVLLLLFVCLWLLRWFVSRLIF
jgi:hypothetical protein